MVKLIAVRAAINVALQGWDGRVVECGSTALVSDAEAREIGGYGV